VKLTQRRNGMCKGCVHIHVADGVITKVFLHLTDLPNDGVIHLIPDATLSTEEFLESHPRDADEVYTAARKDFFNLGDESIQAGKS
jgi:hypothetical protein